MNKEIIKIFKKGAVIKHRGKSRKGTVIDWGTVVKLKCPFNKKEVKRFMLPTGEKADSIRVRTNEGTIEIWPIYAVELLRTQKIAAFWTTY